MDGETLCLDGTTIRASNGRKQSTSVELSRKKLEYARAQLEAVERFLDGMDENDLHEDRIDHPFALDLDKDHLPDPQALRERIAFHEKCIEELEKLRPKLHDLHRPGMRHDARQGGRNQGLLQRSDRGGRVQPHDRRFPRHEQPQRPRADLRERRNVPKESGAEIGERHRRQGLRERRGHRALPS